MENVKHGGCYDCGSKDDQVLTSITKGEQSIAVCSKCLPKYTEKSK